jgi:hypothetical protein
LGAIVTPKEPAPSASSPPACGPLATPEPGRSIGLSRPGPFTTVDHFQRVKFASNCTLRAEKIYLATATIKTDLDADEIQLASSNAN